MTIEQLEKAFNSYAENSSKSFVYFQNTTKEKIDELKKTTEKQNKLLAELAVSVGKQSKKILELTSRIVDLEDKSKHIKLSDLPVNTPSKRKKPSFWEIILGK